MYKCPHCGSKIEVSDTSLSLSQLFGDNSTSFRIETTIRHFDFMDQQCGEIMESFAKDQKNILTKIFQERYPEINDRHGR